MYNIQIYNTIKLSILVIIFILSSALLGYAGGCHTYTLSGICPSVLTNTRPTPGNTSPTGKRGIDSGTINSMRKLFTSPQPSGTYSQPTQDTRTFDNNPQDDNPFDSTTSGGSQEGNFGEIAEAGQDGRQQNDIPERMGSADAGRNSQEPMKGGPNSPECIELRNTVASLNENIRRVEEYSNRTGNEGTINPNMKVNYEQLLDYRAQVPEKMREYNCN